MELIMSKEVKHFYTWEEFDRDIGVMAAWARRRSFAKIYGIPRGGLVLAVALSYHLNLPFVSEIDQIDSQTLIADDMVDTGATALKLEAALGFRPVLAVLFSNDASKRPADFAIQKKIQWVVFPWETEVTSRYDGTFTIKTES